MGDHQDHQLMRVTQPKLKKDQLRQYLTGQFVLMATNIGLQNTAFRHNYGLLAQRFTKLMVRYYLRYCYKWQA